MQNREQLAVAEFHRGMAAASRGDDRGVFEAAKRLIELGHKEAAEVLAAIPVVAE